MENNCIEDTNRTKNDFGHMRITDCVLTAESVDDYMGYELKCDFEGKEENKKYRVYRPLAEIEKAKDTYIEKPVVDNHVYVGADTPNKDKWLGTTGSNPYIEDGKLFNSITVWSNNAIEMIEYKKNNLSSGYGFTIDVKSGIFNNKYYDLIMRNLESNHIAIVKKGRVKEAMVSDEDKQGETVMSKLSELLEFFRKNPNILEDEINKQRETKDMNINEMFTALDAKMTERKTLVDSDKDFKENSVALDSEIKSLQDAICDSKGKKDKKDDKKDDDKNKLSGEDSKVIIEDKYDKDEIIKMAEDSAFNKFESRSKAKDLCEIIIGKSTFSMSTSEEDMYNATIKAKGLEKRIALDSTLEAKKSVLQYISEEPIKIIQDTTNEKVSIISSDAKREVGTSLNEYMMNR